MTRLVERAALLGSVSPEHYLLPKRISGQVFDPCQPASRWAWRTAWRKLTEQAGLKGLRPHDLRHHAITKLAESQASEQTIMAIAGHVSREMLEHYSHIRLEAKRKALESLDNVTFLTQMQERVLPAGKLESCERTECVGVEMVGTGRFELPTPRTPSECSTRLSHVPTEGGLASGSSGGLLGLQIVYHP